VVFPNDGKNQERVKMKKWLDLLAVAIITIGVGVVIFWTPVLLAMYPAVFRIAIWISGVVIGLNMVCWAGGRLNDRWASYEARQ